MTINPCGLRLDDSHTGHLKNVPGAALVELPLALLRVNTLGDSWQMFPVG
jgi:hypothetical protein